MMDFRHEEEPETTVKIEVDLKKIESLIRDGHLCAAQVRCLDSESKQLIHALCLDICAYKLCHQHHCTTLEIAHPSPTKRD